MERDSDEIELDLRLSIGGLFERNEAKSFVEDENVKRENEELRKREMHALRRQEAKKKRDEKQQRKLKGKKNERMRVRESVTKGHEKKRCKREKVVQLNENSNGAFQYPYPQMQYFSFSNGYAFGPYVMPCWTTPEGNSPGNGGGVAPPVRPLACLSFVPYRAPGRGGLENNKKDRKEDESSGSLKGSSSVVSDHQSSSYQGGSSSDTGSHSSHSKPDSQLNGSTANHTGGPHEHTGTSNQAPPAQMIDNDPFSQNKPVTVSVPESSSIISEEKLTPENQLDPSKRTASSVENPASDPVKETEGNTNKPQVPSQSTPTIPQMPCVSTTGDGPNGKKITGFLYRYTKTEVSIVCACHGTSFSPSEFILHAGGTDVTNPLRHITVIPSAFSMTC